MRERKPVWLKRMIQGFAIGAVMLVPGVSGGTMAIILGIYDEMIHSVSVLRKDPRRHGLHLLQYAVAGVAGLVLMSGPMLALLHLWTNPMLFLFIGAITASIPPLWRRVRVAKVRGINLLFSLLGAGIAISTEFLPRDFFQFQEGMSYPVYVLALIFIGIVIAIALILPGISGSYVLLMLGMYDITLLALRQVNLPYLIPLGIGLVVGTYSCAGILEREMKRHPQFTYMLIIGFMIGSVIQIFPGLPQQGEWEICILTFLLGFVAILIMGRGAGKS